METEEITKLVDGIYKNILDKFNPGARQMINAGKAYLKALHGAAAASRMYVDAITKLARQSQQGTWGGSADIGSALMQIVEVYKEIQAQQMNILKAFYVDLLVPLETNLEKDTKVVQSEQKRFLQQHKQRSETYSKAAATIKKQRKKQRNTSKTGIAMDKELKSMQILEEERSKLDAFCEQSLKNAMTQERRRYGFVLERQCSLAKHYLAYHTAGHTLYQGHLDDWQEVAKTREFLPQAVENMFANKLTQVSFWADESSGSPKLDDDRASVNSQLRKTKSMDASCLDMRNMSDMTMSSPPHHPLTRAKSDFNLTASTQSLTQEISNSPSRRPKSMAVAPDTSTWDTPLARAMYAYLSSGENQLSFLEGDVIALMGERNKGWQFGENLRTQSSGWFPLAYTEPFIDDSATTASSPTQKRGEEGGGGGLSSPATGNNARPAPLNRFGDTLAHRSHSQYVSKIVSKWNNRGACEQVGQEQVQSQGGGGASGFSVGGPPTVPAPMVPRKVGGGGSGSGGGGGGTRLVTATVHPHLPHHPATRPPPANASLHSSNDSGFSNDPPPAPEIDYSDDDTARNTVEKNRRNKANRRYIRKEKRSEGSSVNGWLSESMDDWYADDESKATLSRAPMRQASSAGHLATLGRRNESENKIQEVQRQLNAIEIPYDKKVKRTKSLWKFKRGGDEVIEGMAMWKHRSLIDLSGGGGRKGPPGLSLPPPGRRLRDADEETLIEGGGKASTPSSPGPSEPQDSEPESTAPSRRHNGNATPPAPIPILPRTRLINNNNHNNNNNINNNNNLVKRSELHHNNLHHHHHNQRRETAEDSEHQHTPRTRNNTISQQWYNSWDQVKN